MSDDATVVLDQPTRGSGVKAGLAKRTPPDILDQTWKHVPLREFSHLELCGIIHEMGLRLSRRSGCESQVDDSVIPDQSSADLLKPFVPDPVLMFCGDTLCEVTFPVVVQPPNP